MEKNKRLVSVAEALELIPMSRGGLYLAISRGDIPGVVQIGRRKFLRSDALEKLLTEPPANEFAQ